MSSAGDPPTDAEDDAAFLAICRHERKPDPVPYAAGWDAHAAGRGFHEGPKPPHTVEALSWRIGWNDRALKHGR